MIDWQPMDTAPTDGRPILLICEDRGRCVGRNDMDPDVWRACFEIGWDGEPETIRDNTWEDELVTLRPILWMPLPDYPLTPQDTLA